ncbi:MAG TPA: 2Fe-2S iron-sulfur cluster-binding protein [Phycisphaerae bacterium]|nr:2Fe-2S iron-sulfur cluster binding domain-containing protein [Phycisphaerae bacterium]HOI55794.1 2Fe-2S iron-sulfur cluster-binding protein [Phycisphaerae bacterium]
MSETITFTIDGKEVSAQPGQTIMQAADAAGIYIPRLCAFEGLVPHGSCRVCTVMVNGRAQAACTQPVADGIVVENDTEKLLAIRRDIIEMLFVEGNHYCMFCEKSGNCELQALAYRFGIAAPKYPYLFPKREIDATHPDIFIDRNRCVLCGRCVRASRDVDGKGVFEFVGRGPQKRVAVNAEANLADTDLKTSDKAVEVCPVGAILRKRVGYAVPVGRRRYDHKPIGSDIEQAASKK